MAKAVLISIRPEWVERILSGEKTLEVRKTRPNVETPFKVYIYCTSGRPDLNIPISPERLMQDYLDTGSMQSLNCPLGNGKVIGEFVCDSIVTYNYDYCPHPEIGMDYDCGDSWWEIADEDLKSACMTEKEFRYYAFGSVAMYGWHISNLEIYGIPKPLSKFKGLCKIEADCGCCPYYNYTKMDCDGRTIKRPPQSWCYVEGLQ